MPYHELTVWLLAGGCIGFASYRLTFPGSKGVDRAVIIKETAHSRQGNSPFRSGIGEMPMFKRHNEVDKALLQLAREQQREEARNARLDAEEREITEARERGIPMQRSQYY